MSDRPVIQLSPRRAARVDIRPSDVERLQDDWKRRHYIRLPRLFDDDLLSFIQTRVQPSLFVTRVHRNSGVEQCLEAPRLVGMIDFQFNTPALFDLIEAVTGCGHIGAFFGRIYRLTPGTDEGHDWHGDIGGARLLAVSVNLSEGVFEGGVLGLRDTASGRLLSEYANTGAGDGVIFRLGLDIAHRVTPVTGGIARQAYAGWLLSEPEYSSSLLR